MDIGDPKVSWTPWIVAAHSGFEVDDAEGKVGLVQIDRKQFEVTSAFRFNNSVVLDKLVKRLVDGGMDNDDAEAAVTNAASFGLSEDPTDLASIPRFMRWFESSYGRHTLAAILHDNLICKPPNSGALRSDALADEFFRDMMESARVRRLKRMIMWAAVVLRSRWHGGLIRQIAIGFWVLLALLGIVAFVWSLGALSPLDWSHPVDPAYLFGMSLVLPILASALWGSQWRAGHVAAVAALWILPPAVLAVLGYGMYSMIESAGGAEDQ